MNDAAGWLAKHGVREVECLVPDMNGYPRGKVLPVDKFLKVIDGAPLYMPTSVLLVCADGRYSGWWTWTRCACLQPAGRAGPW